MYGVWQTTLSEVVFKKHYPCFINIDLPPFHNIITITIYLLCGAVVEWCDLLLRGDVDVAVRVRNPAYSYIQCNINFM